MRALRRVAVAAAVALAATGFLVVSPAHAAVYNGACGAGYNIVNSLEIGNSGTTFLTYNNANGYNCAVTVRTTPGAPVEMVVGLKRSPDGPNEAVQDAGMYTTYAGPVYLYAAGTCVDWFGYIDGDNEHANGTNCG
ncbi:spore-associated protein A [Nocardiopsis sp. MG754419]|uniref:spore-associated protein A n=1 Tax=Nocardiopsis sp. MG754419 TaxID=2259865 RepID=UPI001BA5DB35|nr:spore-associated protein A [Nocardiopsis sp. MG754419]MBR8744675.1 spore-associated protein A [Nocardiopsis sp. MG754419]